MKKLNRKLLIFLFAAVILAALRPVSVSAKKFDSGVLTPVPISDDEIVKMQATGYIPGKIHGASAVSNAYKSGDYELYNRLAGRQTDTVLPSRYDSRDLGLITSVKNQNPYGSCWAHAAAAGVESYMIKYGIPVGSGSAATTSLNLSETQHCFFNYSSAYDAEGMLTGDKSNPLGDTCMDLGGNGEMSAYTLMRWTGAAPETVSALAYSKASTVARSGLSSQYAYGSNVSHVQNSEWIPATSVEAVKQAIMKYGAGNISYYETGKAYTYICTIDKTSQESSSHKWANHAITVVGWDDSIEVSKFSPNKPSKPGAWICKNSWGTSYFDNGYCYISYEDTTVLEGYIYFYDAAPVDNFDHNYQYDGSCNVVCYGKGWPSGQDYYVGFANNTKVANVFTAKGNESLEAIAFCSWDEAMTYTVEIYKNPAAGNPSSGTKMTSQSGYLTFSGYYTIRLEDQVELSAGDTFSVVITQNVPVADEAGTYVHTPYDASFSNSDVVSWCSWAHADHGATSYYKEPNGSWTDCPDKGDYRIKAYTNDRTAEYTVTFSVPAGITAPAAVTCAQGSAVTLPSADAPAGYTFLGWVEDQYDHVSDRPSYWSGSFTPAGDITLKALYEHTELTEGGFRLVTAAPSDWTGSYIITHGRTAGSMSILKGLAGTRKYETLSAGGSVSLAGSGMTLDGQTLKNADSVYVFEVTAVNGKYALRNESTGTYLASRGSYLYSYKTNSAVYCRWTLSFSAGTAEASNTAGSLLTRLSYADGRYFRIDRTADPDLCFWKKSESTSVTVYTTEIG